MSIARWLTDECNVLSPKGAGFLPSGERTKTERPIWERVPCRIREASVVDAAYFSDDVATTDAYTGWYFLDSKLPGVNDLVMRVSDGVLFKCLSRPKQVGEYGHAMAHIEVQLQRQ